MEQLVVLMEQLVEVPIKEQKQKARYFQKTLLKQFLEKVTENERKHCM
jgi:hypothetical protein